MSDTPGKPAGDGSHRDILRATSISGGAAIVNIVVSIIRVKALAVIVGPAGIGMLGLLQRVMTLAITLSSLGLTQSGGRHIAAASGDPVEMAHMRRALFLASIVMGLGGLIVVWFFRESIAIAVFGNTTYATEVGLVGLGVLLNAVTASQTGLLQGLRRIEDLARITIIATIAGGALAVGIIWQLGEDGIIWMMIATPLVGALVALRFTGRLPRPERHVVSRWADLVPRWRALLTMGFAVFAGGLVATLVQLEARKAVVLELGLVEAGRFEAAWQISMLYVGFVLAAMGTDYLPRLTGLVHDPVARRRLVNEQTEIALMLAAPVLVGLAGLAPLVVRVLYSSDFDITADLLRLHVIGDIAKLLAWPLAFALLAFGANRLFIIGEFIWSIIYLSMVLLLVPEVGLVGTAVAYVAAFVVYVTYLMIAVHRFMGIGFGRVVVRQTTFILLTAGVLIVVGIMNVVLGVTLGLVATVVTAWFSLSALVRMVGPTSRIGRLLGRIGIGRAGKGK